MDLDIQISQNKHGRKKLRCSKTSSHLETRNSMIYKTIYLPKKAKLLSSEMIMMSEATLLVRVSQSVENLSAAAERYRSKVGKDR
jgi:hypothetical protein